MGVSGQSDIDTEKPAKRATICLTDSRADRYFGEAQVHFTECASHT